MGVFDIVFDSLDNLFSSSGDSKVYLRWRVKVLSGDIQDLQAQNAKIYDEFQRQDEEIRQLREELKTERAKTRRSAVIEETGLPPCKSALCKSCKYAATATDEDGRFMLGCIKALNGCYEKDERAARIEELEKALKESISREMQWSAIQRAFYPMLQSRF